MSKESIEKIKDAEKRARSIIVAAEEKARTQEKTVGEEIDAEITKFEKELNLLRRKRLKETAAENEQIMRRAEQEAEKCKHELLERYEKYAEDAADAVLAEILK